MRKRFWSFSRSRITTAAIAAIGLLTMGAKAQRAADHVFIETESLAKLGGWVIDQQFMDQMGSPYLLAHGLGEPVPDAVGEVKFPAAGEYRVWVRTRDWVAPWKAPGAPGKFQVLINGQPLAPTFGTVNERWHWQDGGIVSVGETATVALHDLTGFEGRCDAILFCRELNFTPPHEGPELAAFRAARLGWSHAPVDGGSYDLVVVGGGIAGTSAAVTAARQGLTVALVQDRPVLGGNGSSEVRVPPEGHTNQQPYPRIGAVVRELVPKKERYANHEDYQDKLKEHIVRNEKNITLLLNHRVIAATAENQQVQSVVAQRTDSGQRTKINGRCFLDSTGDAVLGAMVGADFEIQAGGAMGMTNPWSVGTVEQNEHQLKCLCKDDEPISFAFTPAAKEQPFPRCPWALDLSEVAFPGRKQHTGQWVAGGKPLTNLGKWFWESGFNRHPIDDAEYTRDFNLRAMYGAWDVLKNVDHLYPTERLQWAAFIAGKRESRRLLGDFILTADDFRKGTKFEDAAFPCTWHIDLHSPDNRYDDHGAEPFISVATESKEFHYKGPYWAPYRCLYSRNIGNLFMAGRNISVSHDGLGAVRVMKTCGMMGEIVGMAASLCKAHTATPRDVYGNYLPELIALMQKGSGNPLLNVPKKTGIDPAELTGIIVDNSQAELNGDWRTDGQLPGFIGADYAWSNEPGATASFPLTVPVTCMYDLRATWKAHRNRATAAVITIHSAGGIKTITLDQSQAPSGEQTFQSLGQFKIEAKEPAKAIYWVTAGQGIVHVDALQLIEAR